MALALAALTLADSVTPAGSTAVGPFEVQCRSPTEEAGADCAWTLVAWTVYAVLLRVALLALSLSWLGRARRGWRTTPRSLPAGEPEPDQEPDATTAGSSARDAGSTA